MVNILCSSLILMILIVYLKHYKYNITLLHFLIIPTFLTYMLLPTISGYTVPYFYEEEYFLFTLGYTVSIILLVIGFEKTSLKGFFDIKSMIELSYKIKNIHFYLLFVLFILTIYYFLQNGLIFRLGASETSTGYKLYRVLFANFILPSVYLLIFIGISNYSLQKSIFSKLIFILIISSAVMYTIFTGRRDLILSVLLIVFVISIKKEINILNIKYLPLLIISLIFIALASNFYQSIRYDTYLFTTNTNEFSQLNIWDGIFDFSKSESNLQVRQTAMDFNLLITQKYVFGNTGLEYGYLFWKELLNTIPKILLPGKTYINIDDLLAISMFISKCDFPTTVIGSLIADFGLLSFFIYPLVILSFLFIISKIMKLISISPILYIYIFINTLETLANPENSTGSLFSVIRAALIITAFGYISIYWLKKKRKI